MKPSQLVKTAIRNRRRCRCRVVVLPMDVDGVARDLRRRAGPARRAQPALAHPARGPHRARADGPPGRPRGRRRRRLAGDRRASCPASGRCSTAHRDAPLDETMAAAVRTSTAKEHVLLAVMAGLAGGAGRRRAAPRRAPRGARPGRPAARCPAHAGRRPRRQRRARPAGAAQGGPRRLTPPADGPGPTHALPAALPPCPRRPGCPGSAGWMMAP